jgi:glycolate oxidase iron-sulfur subunit
MQAVACGELEAEDIAEQLDFCLGCRACETACPAGVVFGRLLETGRAVTRDKRMHSRGGRWLQNLALRTLLPSPILLWLLASLVRLYQVSGLQYLVRASGLLQRVTPSLAPLEASLPHIPSFAARRALPPETPPQETEQGCVAMLTGCVMPEVLPRVNDATRRVLAANGYRVLAPPAQRCCGALQAHAGDLEEARRLARHNIAVFEAAGASVIAVNSAGCGAMMKEYGHLLADDPYFATRAEAFSARVRDVSEVLAPTPLRGSLHPLPLRVAYDDPCHLLHGQHISAEPRTLLRQVPALQLLDVPESDWCCGSAGIYNILHAETAQALLDRKMTHIASVHPQVIASGNPGCLLQLRQGARRHQLAVDVLHPMEILALAYDGTVPGV